MHRYETGTSVSFDCEGCRLFGSLHMPEEPVADAPAIILLNQGPVDRGGSHRLYVKLAWRLTAMGLAVLRFDARGVGESEGSWADESRSLSILDAYGEIQSGAWVPDTKSAIEFMRDRTGSNRVILGGLCGGAATALLTGADHPAVLGMFVIGTPLTFSSVTRRVADLPEAIIQRDSRRYFQKLLDPASWRRFLSLQTDYRTLVGVFATQLKRRLHRATNGNERPAESDGKVNIPLITAINSSRKSRKPLLVVFGENDYLWHEFQEQMWRFGDEQQRLFELSTIADANHTLTEEPWQQALFDSVTSWLGRSFTSNKSRQSARGGYAASGSPAWHSR
jgi:pimeloyl-ACP methyl ester carboxylesterase